MNSQGKKVGPLVIILIIILVLIAIVLYAFASHLNKTGQSASRRTVMPTQAQPLNSNSTDLKSIQQDLNSVMNSVK